MKIKKHVWLVVVVLLLLVFLPAGAQGGSISLDWYTVDSGGGLFVAGGFSLSGTSGQPDAGELRSGGYTLIGGFWPAALPCCHTYLPLVLQ